ncbi:MAG: ATP synthase subunit I [Burkholderiales bacterium]
MVEIMALDHRTIPGASKSQHLPAYRSWGNEDADDVAEAAFKPLSREAAQALRERDPSISPWRVVAVQLAAGFLVAVAAWLLSGQAVVAWSAVYGAAVVVVPGALLARGMTSQLSTMAPAVAAVSFMVWEFVKIIVSVLMLALAPKVLHTPSWPALLLALVVCIKVYWVALLWRGSKKH